LKICRNCRRENRDDATFCVACGFSLDWGDAATTTVTTTAATNVIADVPPPPVEPPRDEPQPLEAPLRHAAVSLALASTRLAGRRGQATGCEVRVRNDADRPESYRFDVGGAGAPFGAVSPNPIAIDAGQEASALLAFRFPPEHVPSSLDFDVRATAEGHSEVTASAAGTISVQGRRNRALLGAMGLGGIVAIGLVATGHWVIVLVALLIGAAVSVWKRRRSSR
jgi:zinc ribbon protein